MSRSTAGRIRRHRARFRLALVALGFVVTAWTTLLSAQTSTASMRLLDNFSDLAPWKAVASDGVQASLQPAQGPKGAALRLDFDLGGTAGYAIARRALPIDFPANYEISFYVRADAPTNDLQVKLIDASGDNVWWFNRRNFEFPQDWQHIRIKKRHVDFAWHVAGV